MSPNDAVMEFEVPGSGALSSEGRSLLDALGMKPGDFVTLTPNKGTVEIVRSEPARYRLLSAALLSGALHSLFAPAAQEIDRLDALAVKADRETPVRSRRATTKGTPILKLVSHHAKA